MPKPPPATRKSAVISECSRYRYELHRGWGEAAPEHAVFVLLNPSTADDKADDPTVRKCMGFAKLLGCNGIVVVNLFAWRCTKPQDLPKEKALAVGPETDTYLLRAVQRASTRHVICGWGTHGAIHDRGAEVLGGLRAWASTLGAPTPLAFARNKDGSPGHPLYLPYKTRLVSLC